MNSIKVNEITSSVIFDKLKPSWNSLLIQQSHLSFFLSWEWLNTWWHNYTNDSDKLLILTFEEDKELIGIVPFYIQNNEIIRFIGTGEPETEEVASEYLDIICSQSDVNKITPFLIATLNEKLKKANKLELNNYLINSAIHKTVNKLKKQYWYFNALSGVRYQASLQNGLTNYKESCSKSLIKKIIRNKIKFSSSLNGKVTPYHYKDKVDEGLNILAKLHKKRWKKKNLPGAFSSKKFFEFHYQFCQLALENNWLKIYTLESNETKIAAIYNISFQKTCYFYQIGIDSDFKPNISPGNLIHYLLIEQSIDDGLYFYDFMKGNEKFSYKSSLSNIKTEMYSAIFLKKNKSNFCKMLVLQKKNFKSIIRKWHDSFQNR